MHPALSFLDLAWVRLGVDPLELGVRLVDGHRFAAGAAGERGPLLVAHVHNQRVLSDIKLGADVPDDAPVTVLQRLGGPDEVITEVDVGRPRPRGRRRPPHVALDPAARRAHRRRGRRLRRAGHDPAGVVPVGPGADPPEPHPVPARGDLRGRSRPSTRLPEGADGTDPAYAALEDELGDLLFQVVFHARLAAEVGAFTLADVARGIHEKLVRRHPHVFEGASSEMGDITRRWEDIKREERGGAGVMDTIPATLPAVLYAAKVLRKAAAAGHPWTPDDARRARRPPAAPWWPRASSAASTPRPPCGAAASGSGTRSPTSCTVTRDGDARGSAPGQPIAHAESLQL